jgi:hypothetical protein
MHVLLSESAHRIEEAPLHALRADWQTRLVAMMLALGVVTAHVTDQGGITELSDPHWIGWGYRLIEVGGLATALVVALLGHWRPAWAAAVLLGAGPMLGYLASRTISLPGDSADVGNWGDWVGTMSLLFEASLIVLAVNVLLRSRHRDDAPPIRAGQRARLRTFRVRHPAG